MFHRLNYLLLTTMSINDFLDFNIIDAKNYHISVFTIVVVFGIIIGTWFFLTLLKALIARSTKNLPFDGGRKHSIFLICKYITWVVSVLFCLQVLDIKITLLLAGSAALLVGLGLGIQQIFNDLVSGMFLLFEGSVQIGDILEIDGMVCRVKEIKLRTSLVETRDSIVKIVPNHKFINDTVTNWSRQTSNYARFRLIVGVSYKSDPEHVRKVLTDVMERNSDVLDIKDKEPKVRFSSFGDSSINFEMVFWSERLFRIENVLSDIRYEVFKRLREEGIEIPFPQRDIHLKSSNIGKFYKED